MNRRNFLRSLAIGVAAVTLRLRPESALPVKPPELESGYVYAPYMPLYVTNAISVADFNPRLNQYRQRTYLKYECSPHH